MKIIQYIQYYSVLFFRVLRYRGRPRGVLWLARPDDHRERGLQLPLRRGKPAHRLVEMFDIEPCSDFSAK